MSGFSIDAGGFGWIMGTPDEPGDRCLHGHAAARIGAETLEYDCTVSAADWSVYHEGDIVRLVTPSGAETRVPIADYAREVCRFADEVAAFYARCTPKTEPEDDFDRRGWLAFRREWRRRRSEAAREYGFGTEAGI